MIIQIYEIQNPSEAAALIELGVDHIGSVLLSEQGWKVPAIQETIQLVNSTSAKSSLLPLFNDVDSVLRTLDYYHPHIVHFCEALTNEAQVTDAFTDLIKLQQDVKERFPEIQIMRSIPIGQPGSSEQVVSLQIARLFEPVSDFFLTDTLIGKQGDADFDEQPVPGFVGVTGQPCDWELASSLVQSSSIPVILAGGLSAENVGEAIKQVRPSGVDSCTLTNAVAQDGQSIRFKKDLQKVKQFVEEVREAQKEIGRGQSDLENSGLV